MTKGKSGQKKLLLAILATVCLGVVWLTLSSYYRLSPVAFIKESVRVVAAPVGAMLGRDDIRQVEKTTASYRVGASDVPDGSPRESWEAIGTQVPGFHLATSSLLPSLSDGIPFVYQSASAEYLQKFRATYHLDEIVRDAPSEYDSMLRLGGWMGSQWDHGTDMLPDDGQVCDPVAVVEKGRNGAKYWCEIAARTLVHAANALGWQARLITGSTDGYTWEHAVAELWSNQFGKWFVIDADFNIVYEEAGVPLSAFELHTRGRELQRKGRLRVRPIAPPKPSLPPADVLPFYAYIHIDMRSDWCTRRLRRGSPAGGDRATWWTASPELSHLLTAKTRVDDGKIFDWSVNPVALYASAVRHNTDGPPEVLVSLGSYSPAYARFEVREDAGEWQRIDGFEWTLPLRAGTHSLRARVITANGAAGPDSHVDYSMGNPALSDHQ